MNEVFHEDIFETFVFCFLASLGIIQFMTARRGWHGLSLYGGRVRENVNRALGTALVIFAYAWYFSDPLHRNVRNIEALLSMVCLVLGILAAAAFSCLAASLSESLLRWGRRDGREDGGDPAGAEIEIPLPGGAALIHGGSRAEGPERRLVVLCEPGGLNRHLARSLCRFLPRGTAAAFLWTRDLPFPEGEEGEEGGPSPESLLHELEARELFSPQGSVFLGLGWGADWLLAFRRKLEADFQPASFTLLAPVLPVRGSMTLGDSLCSNTPLDILGFLAAARPWREGGFRSLLRVWAPAFGACALVSTGLTASLRLRWWFLSGPLGGTIASLWVAYYLDRALRRRRAEPAREGWESRMARALSVLELSGGSAPLTVILTGDQAEDNNGGENYPLPVDGKVVVWRDALRGKFLLSRINAERLARFLFPHGG
ncbi:MAG: hypothetical protein ACUVRX_03380 [Actinomycetota bacterium]